MIDAFEKDWHFDQPIKPQAPAVGFYDDRPKSYSDNHWKMAIAVRYAIAEEPAERAAARLVLVDWLRREQEVGFWMHEQCCGDAHDGMHLQALLVAIMGALRWKDSTLLFVLNARLRDFYAVCFFCSTPAGSVIVSGERQPNGPIMTQASAVWRVAKELPQQGELGDHGKGEKPWLIPFNTAARAARALKRRGELEVPTSTAMLPKMRGRLEIYRKPGTHSTVAVVQGGYAWSIVDHQGHDRDGRPGNVLAGVTWGLEQKPSAVEAVMVAAGLAGNRSATVFVTPTTL